MINELLHKYLYERLSREESERFKHWADSASSSALEETLSEQWEKHTIQEPRNWEAYRIVTGKLQAILGDRMISPKRSLRQYITRVAAMLLLPLLLAGGVYLLTKRYEYKKYAATQYRMETGKGERATLILPDGTKVSLNSESVFTYPASFGKTDRNVRLEGEAYFEVTHDEELPFLVQLKQAYVKVLGTTFNIHAYPVDSWVETALVEGQVEFYEAADPNNRITLSPDQTARFDMYTCTFERNPLEQRLATAWKRGEIIFRSASWPSIIEQISNYYGVMVQQEGVKIPQEQFTGSFRHEDVNNVLRNLQALYHFSYTKTGNLIKIKFE